MMHRVIVHIMLDDWMTHRVIVYIMLDHCNWVINFFDWIGLFFIVFGL